MRNVRVVPIAELGPSPLVPNRGQLSRNPWSDIPAYLEYFLELLNGLSEGTGWLTGLKLLLQLDKTAICGDKALRQDPCNVKERDRIFSKKRCVGNMKLRVLQGPNVCCMRLL